ncbi:type II secretion system protein [Candidatus Roizmanbacteria bacterium]|nr:type II secretion system protein [Candidatus Roizmanbacteria bacterium]
MKKSFTLIETIVVIAVIGLTLPVLFAIILTLMKQQVKIYRLSQIKRGGDYVINLMENIIRDNAVTIHTSTPPSDVNIICKNVGTSAFGTSLYFLDKNKQWFGYLATSNSVASTSANLASPINLTPNKTIVSNFSIYCSRNSIYSPAAILLSFDICYDTGSGVCTGTRPEEVTSMHYQTRIKLRSY